jgi:hypothetical protein
MLQPQSEEYNQHLQTYWYQDSIQKQQYHITNAQTKSHQQHPSLQLEWNLQINV